MTRGPNLARREEILDQLQEIFLREGFLQLRIGALASRLNCSRSTLYELADSKEALFARVVERFADTAVQQAMEAAGPRTDPAGRFLRFFEVIAQRQAAGSPAFWRDAYAYGPTADRFAKKRAWGVEVLRGYLEDGIADGFFRPVNTDFVAHVIWLIARASRDQDLLGALGLSTDRALGELGQILMFGMVADRSAVAD